MCSINVYFLPLTRLSIFPFMTFVIYCLQLAAISNKILNAATKIDRMHQSIPSVPIPPGISGAFFLIVRPGGRALV